MTGEAGPLWPAFDRPGEPDVLGIGECSVDHVCTLERLPGPGGKAPLGAYAVRPGGTVATALRACQRLGLRTAYAGSVGDDPGATLALAPLEADGVDLRGVRVHPGVPTRLAVVLVEGPSGERRVLGYRDPRLRLPAGSPAGSWVGRCRSLLVDTSELEVARLAAQEARSRQIPVVLDADTLVPGLDALLRHVDFPIVSEAFAEEFSGVGSASEGLRRLVAGGARLAVATRGPNGAVALGSVEGALAVSAYRVETRDTTGAGDVFHAGFLWAVLRGCDARGALRLASAAGAWACRGAGAQGSLPGPEEIETLEASREESP